MASINFVRHWLAGCAAAALLVGAISPAHAIKYVGSFDPAYDNVGDKYDGKYGFRGEALFEVSSDCLNVDLGSSTYYVAQGYASTGGACSTISVLSASLTIYQIDSLYYNETSDYFRQTTREMTDLEDLPLVYGIVVKNGQVDGVVTNYFGGNDFILNPLPINESTSPSLTFQETLWMRFFDPRIAAGNELNSVALTGPGEDPVTTCNFQPVGTTCPSPGVESNPSNAVVFRQVPEPSSLALVALALGASGALARRRRPDAVSA